MNVLSIFLDLGDNITKELNINPNLLCVKVKDETTMVLSRGIGNSLFPFRVNNQPELVIVNLKK